MRLLIIKREKSFVACLFRIKVYVEDPMSGELVINNVSYRKLGELKNGEEKAFTISEDECRIAVIADKLSKDICNDIYTVPAGVDDVFLSGKNVFNPATGNAFRFNNVADKNTLKNRSKSLTIGVIIICAAVVFGYFAGYYLTGSLLRAGGPPKDFSKGGDDNNLKHAIQRILSSRVYGMLYLPGYSYFCSKRTLFTCGRL